MKEICKKEKCSGCGACLNICPTNAITMKEDYEGFLYPEISDKCIDCGKCKSVCPQSIMEDEYENICDVYAIQLKDKKKLKNSSSGGMFMLLAEYVIENGGVVFGASYDEDLVVRHTYAERMEELSSMQGSKYAQSDIRDCYRKAEDSLKNNRHVLFSGTPCQTEGLRTYLGKNYEKLILLDIICSGVPSPMLFKKCIESIEKKDKSKVFDYRFRDKEEFGYSNTTVIYERKIKNKKVNKITIPDRTKNAYYIAFGKQAFLRKSCYECTYGKVERHSDFTCGDYVGTNNKILSMGNYDGISEIIIHTKKGQCVFEKLKDKIKWQSISIDDAKEGNKMLYSSLPASLRCPEMFSYLHKYGYNKTAKKFFPVLKITVTKRIIRKLKAILKKFILIEK